MIYAALFLLIVLHGFLDGAMDGERDLRVHMSAHPFRDLFHLAKHFSRGALIGVGLNVGPSWWADPASCVIVCISGVVIGRLVWDWAYTHPWYWLRLDERVKVTTGWKWLDRVLGLHW